MNLRFANFSNFGFVRDTVPPEILSVLKQEIDQIDLDKADPISGQLAGNIEKQFELSSSNKVLEPYILHLCHEYLNTFNPKYTFQFSQIENLKLNTSWVNFQKKNEFNPIHTHDGFFSFVIWIKIPYSVQAEIAQPHVANSNMQRAGMFSFMYTNVFGEIRESVQAIDSSFEGEIFLFPASFMHQVYPFSTSDEYRISISGNIVNG